MVLWFSGAINGPSVQNSSASSTAGDVRNKIKLQMR